MERFAAAQHRALSVVFRLAGLLIRRQIQWLLQYIFFTAEEHDHHGNKCHEAGRHQRVGPSPGERLVHSKAERNGKCLKVGEIEQRIEKLLPVVDETEHGGNGDGGSSHGKQHVPIDPPRRSAVKAGGVVQFFRDAVESGEVRPIPGAGARACYRFESRKAQGSKTS